MTANVRDIDPRRNTDSKAATRLALVIVACAMDEYDCKGFRWKAENRQKEVSFGTKVGQLMNLLFLAGHVFVHAG